MAEGRLVIGLRLLRRILEHCLEEKPYEACGILAGRAGRVSHVYALLNVKRSPVFYEIDAEQQERVLREVRARGDELVGIYHSHPTMPAVPSRTDIRQAVHYPDAVRMIISLAGPTDVRAFLIRDGQVRDVTLVVAADADGEFHDLRHAAYRGE